MSRLPPWTFGLLLLALIWAGQAVDDGSMLHPASDGRTAVWVALGAASTAVYLLAVRAALRTPGPLWRVLALAVALRIGPLIGPQFLSSDLFRYVWDGRVQLHGINPYSYFPAEAPLSFLRDTAIFPHINRADYAHTIYPPAAEMVFALVAAISQTQAAMRIAMVLAEAVACAALIAVLRRTGQPAARVMIYAWSPLAVWEFAGNGHVDALPLCLVALALLAYAAARPGWVGAAMAAAVCAKFLPAALAPTLWRRGDWRAPAAGIAAIAALYAPYVVWSHPDGSGVFGFLGGYADEEGVGDGSGLWPLAPLAPLPGWLVHGYLLAIAAALLGLGWVASGGARDPVRAARFAGRAIVILMVAISPHYPWYYPWALVPAVIAPARASIWLGSAAILLYLSPLHERFIWPSLIYLPTLALAVWDARRPLLPEGTC